MTVNKMAYLSTFIQKKYSLSQKDAEEFVGRMFGVLNEALRTEKLVKIKGLGTFKITSINPRESINVNTGERFVIEGRERILFTSETSMRDRVNKPFSQFETVALNDDIDFSEIDKKYNMLHEEGAEDVHDEVDVDEAVELQLKKVAEAESAESQPRHSENEETVPSPDAECVSEPNAVVPADVPEMVAAPEIDVAEVPRRRLIEELLEEQLQRSNRFAKMWAAVAVVLLIGGGIGAYYIKELLTDRDRRIEHLETMLSQQREAAQKRTEVKKDTVVAPVLKPTAEKNSENQSKREGAEAFTDYNKDMRVKTGAYTIVGIGYKIRAMKGQTLQSISKAHLGAGMECYVEVVNGKKEFKEGEMVKIPALKLKKRKNR